MAVKAEIHLENPQAIAVIAGKRRSTGAHRGIRCRMATLDLEVFDQGN
ncbi:hypothetical protein [Burkholderia ubonensis]|nr:hypothetical protein [Burkholderia ubonensis]